MSRSFCALRALILLVLAASRHSLSVITRCADAVNGSRSMKAMMQSCVLAPEKDFLRSLMMRL